MPLKVDKPDYGIIGAVPPQAATKEHPFSKGYALSQAGQQGNGSTGSQGSGQSTCHKTPQECFYEGIQQVAINLPHADDPLRRNADLPSVAKTGGQHGVGDAFVARDVPSDVVAPFLREAVASSVRRRS